MNFLYTIFQYFQNPSFNILFRYVADARYKIKEIDNQIEIKWNLDKLPIS